MAAAYGQARGLEKCCMLIGGGTAAWLFISRRMVRIVIRFQTSRQSADLLAVFACRISGVTQSSSLLLMLTFIIDLDNSRIIIYE